MNEFQDVAVVMNSLWIYSHFNPDVKQIDIAKAIQINGLVENKFMVDKPTYFKIERLR